MNGTEREWVDGVDASAHKTHHTDEVDMSRVVHRREEREHTHDVIIMHIK